MTSKYDTPSSEMSVSPTGSHISVTPKKSSLARRRMFASPSNSNKITVIDEKSPLGCTTIPPTPDSGNSASPRRSPRFSKFASTPKSENAQSAQSTMLRVKRKLIDETPNSRNEHTKTAKKQKTSPKQKKRPGKRVLGGINAGVSHAIKRPKPKPSLVTKQSKTDGSKQMVSDKPNRPKTTNENTTKDVTGKTETKKQQSIDIKAETTSKIVVTQPLYDIPTTKDSGPKKFFKSRENEKTSRAATVLLSNNLRLELRESEPKQSLRRSPRKHKTAENTLVLDLVDDWDDSKDSADITNIINKLEISPNDVEVMDVSENPKDCENLIQDIPNSAEKPSSNESPKLFPIFQKGAKHDEKTLKSRSDNAQVAIKQWSRLRADGPTQCILDAGQKVFGAIKCNQCGLLYHAKDPDDEILHAKLHDNLNTCLKFPGWKNEHVVRRYGSEGQVIVVSPRDAAHCWRKVNDVLNQVVDIELGFAEIGIRRPEHTKVYFYVTEKKIVGVLVAERISKAYRLLHAAGQESGRCCSDIPENVLVGVSRIWTLETHRRLKVASRLVDSMKSDFIFGQIIDVSQIAFSDPTESGIQFAEKYTKREDFLVYNM